MTLKLTKWLVRGIDPDSGEEKKTKLLKLADAKKAEKFALNSGWNQIEFLSENGMNFYDRPSQYVVNDKPHACCGKKFEHASDCWVIGGNVG